MIIFGRHLSIELINGCGLFLEMADSRAVWVMDEQGELYSMPFEGVLLYLPFILITYGKVYHNE